MKTKQIFLIATLIISAMYGSVMVASQGSFQALRKKLAEEVQHQLIIRAYFEAQQTKNHTGHRALKPQRQLRGPKSPPTPFPEECMTE